MQCICSKTVDEGIQHNNNICNDMLPQRDAGRGYACYYCCIPSSSPVLLHIHCTCFSTFWYCYPYTSFNILMEIVLLLFHWFFVVYSQCSLHVCEPSPFCCLWSYEMHMGNKEEMAFNYTEVVAYHGFTRPRGVLQRFRW